MALRFQEKVEVADLLHFSSSQIALFAQIHDMGQTIAAKCEVKMAPSIPSQHK